MWEDQEIIVQPLSGAVGAVIEGVDLSQPLSEPTLAKLKRTYDEFGVIFFRDQQLSPEDHIAFAEQWGKINVNRFFQPVEGYPRTGEVSVGECPNEGSHALVLGDDVPEPSERNLRHVPLESGHLCG